MQTASVDIIDGRAVSSPVRAYHLRGRCYDEQGQRGSLSRTPRSLPAAGRTARTGPHTNEAGLGLAHFKATAWGRCRRPERPHRGGSCASSSGHNG